MIKVLTNDSSFDVRNAALITIGTIKRSVSSLGKLLDNIPLTKIKKIDEVVGLPPAGAVVEEFVGVAEVVPEKHSSIKMKTFSPRKIKKIVEIEDEAIPRATFFSKIFAKAIRKLSDPNWKLR
jgi:hypothetical protein